MHTLLHDMDFCEVIGLGGDVICKVRVSQHTTIRSLKRELAAITNIPVQLQQIICHDEVVADDQLCFCNAECNDHSVILVILPIPSACTTAEEICEVLLVLTELGSQALAPHIDDIVSFLGRTFDTAEDSNHPSCSHGFNHNSSRKVHVSALKALASAGELCSPLCKEILATMPVFMEARWAEHTVNFNFRIVLPWTDSWASSSILDALHSLLSAIGPAGLHVIMDGFSDTFHGTQECQKKVALAAIADAMLSFNELQLHCIDWLAAFISESNVWLSYYALQFLNHMMLKNPDLSIAMEPYIPTVLSCFDWRVESFFLLSAACKFLGNYSHHVVPHMKHIVSAFLASIREEDARREIAVFQQLVKRKPHGAYMFYMKSRGSLAPVFSLFFKRLGYECCTSILHEYADIPSHAGPSQKALLLLSAAQLLPTFTKSQASVCATWFSVLLNDVNWQLRMCAIYCLQRLMAGYMGPEPHIHGIALLLEDKEPFVRQSAATALGCLGRRVVCYEKTLLSLLMDYCSSVRYAALVTLGGLMALARRHYRTISRYLDDKDPKCRMAALRVLKNSGLTAAPFLDQLQAWRQRWYDGNPWTSKPECVTARALMFPTVCLKHIFKGHAPLGLAFGGPKATRDAREREYTWKLSQAEAKRPQRDEEVVLDLFPPVSDIKESREHYRAVQQRHHDRARNRSRARKQNMAQWHLKLKEGFDPKTLLAMSRKVQRFSQSKLHSVRAHVETIDEWVVPIVQATCCNMDVLDDEQNFAIRELCDYSSVEACVSS